jgi:hypothetical protein
MRRTISMDWTKRFRLDQRKLARARKVLGASTDAETIEKALDFVLEEHARNKAAHAAHARLILGAIEEKVEIRDVFGALPTRTD